MIDNELTPSEIEEMAAILGGEVQPLFDHPDEREVALVLNDMRGLLIEATNAEDVGVNELADRLGVSPSAVSRMIRREGDLRVSTAVLWAFALGRTWRLHLSKFDRAVDRGNYQAKWEVISHRQVAETSARSNQPTVKYFQSPGFGDTRVSLQRVGA